MNGHDLKELLETMDNVADDVVQEAICQWLADRDINLKLIGERVDELCEQGG